MTVVSGDDHQASLAFAGLFAPVADDLAGRIAAVDRSDCVIKIAVMARPLDISRFERGALNIENDCLIAVFCLRFDHARSRPTSESRYLRLVLYRMLAP